MLPVISARAVGQLQGSTFSSTQLAHCHIDSEWAVVIAFVHQEALTIVNLRAMSAKYYFWSLSHEIIGRGYIEFSKLYAIHMKLFSA